MSDQQNPGTAITISKKDGQIQTLDYGDFAGVGSLDLPTTGRIKFLSIIQSSSKAVKKGHEKFIPGASTGDFLLGDEVLDGTKGVYFIGIEKEHVLVEITKLDGTGELVAEHDPNGDVAKAAREKYGSNRINWRSDKGNFLVDSIRLYGVVFDSKEDMDALKPKCAAIVDFRRTKMRAWESFISPFNKCKERGRPPLFAAKLHITTVMQNSKGHDFYNLRISFAEGDDFGSSLILPTNADGTPNTAFIEFGKECLQVAAGVRSGSLRGEDTGPDSDDDGADGVPF